MSTDLALSNSLTDLAAQIRKAHADTIGALKRGLEHALVAGDLLIEAKAQLEHGQWLPWLQEHCEISERTAQLYMRLSRNRPEIEAKSATVADLSLRGAVDLLAPPDPPPACSPIPDVTVMQFVILKLLAIEPRLKMTKVGMQFPDDLTLEQWVAIGQVLAQIPIAEVAA